MDQTAITRREMGRLLAAGAAALAWGGRPLRAQDSKPFALRYVLGSCMYGRMPLEEILPEVRKIGAEHIDLWPEPHGNQREQIDTLGHDKFAALLAQHQVQLGILTRYDLGPFRLGDEMRVLRKFGARLLVTGSRYVKELSASDTRPAVKQFVEELAPHAALAEELGVTIGIENHGKALLCSPDSLRCFAELARSPNVGIALAPYHLPQDPQALARLIEDLGPKLVHFYAWQEGKGCFKKLPKDEELEQLPGRGALDFRPVVTALQKIGYQGWSEIFMHPVPRGVPIMGTRQQVTDEINRARQYLDGLCRN